MSAAATTVRPTAAVAKARGLPGRVQRVFGAWVLALGASVSSMAMPADVESVRAAYVVNFVRYARWPDSDSDQRPYVIAVLGTPASAAALREMTARIGRVQGHPLSVRLLPLNSSAPARDTATNAVRQRLDDARVVYIDAAYRTWNDAVIAAAAGKPVLTIGEGGDFVRAGGMFGLFETQDRVLFSANEPAIRKSSIDVSARVLLLARPAPGDGAR